MSEAAAHTALEVDADGAVAWAAAHPGWFIFPGKLVRRDDGSWTKVPLVKWQSKAAKDPTAIRAMWKGSVGGGTAAVCVACAPSNIWVLDCDTSIPEHDDAGWAEILDVVLRSRMTSVFRSCTKGRPHFVFKQDPALQDGKYVAEGKWRYGDIKSAGMIVISSEPPIVDAPLAAAPSGLLDRLEKKGRLRGASGLGLASDEELWNWLLSTPDDDLLLSEAAGRSFLEQVVKNLEKAVDGGEHRRQATLAAVFQAAIEAAAGCYPAEQAYLTLRDIYQEMRELTPAKGWNRDRAKDYDGMWAGLVPRLLALETELVDKIAEQRAGVAERFDADGDDDDLSEVMEWWSLVTGVRSTGIGDTDLEEPVKVMPPGGPAARSPGGPVSATAIPVSAIPVDERAWPSPGPETETGGDGDDDGGREPPELSEGALWGPHGELITALVDRTESSVAGLLGALLGFSGVVLGGRAHFRIGVDIHGPNLYVLNLGVSAAARKSSGLSLVEYVFYDGAWMADLASSHPAAAMIMPRKLSGVASGERLIHVWSPSKVADEDGGGLDWPERRVLLLESEASVLWKRSRRDGAIMSDIICKMWDQAELATHALTSGSVTVPAQRHLAGFLGASTLHVARKAVTAGDGLDAMSGFGNRFLWFYLPDSGVDLPFGAELPDRAILDYRDQIWFRSAGVGPVEGGDGEPFGKPVRWANDARDRWAEVYPHIKREKGTPGFVEGMCSRGESQVVRLALNYQLAAGLVGPERDEVSLGALEAALAVWAYCKDSVEHVFGRMTGSSEMDDLMSELAVRGGWATMEELKEDANRATLARRIAEGLRDGWLVEGRIKTGKSGRPPRVFALTARRAAGTLSGESSGLRMGSRNTAVPLLAVSWKT